MDNKFKVEIAIDEDELASIYRLSRNEWGQRFDPEIWSNLWVETHKLKDATKQEGFFIRNPESSEIIAGCVVVFMPAFYKDVRRLQSISTIPEPSMIGVLPATAMFLTHVVVDEKFRKQGLAEKLIRGAISFTERAVIQENLKKSNGETGSFKDLVMSEGRIDYQLANYYLSKKYVWSLYSGVGKYYERFGFKAFPNEQYEIDYRCFAEMQGLIKQMLELPNAETSHVGKRLRLLRHSDPKDQEVIKAIFQAREVSLLTEMNETIFHSDLGNGRRSSSSLTNMPTMLHFAKQGSFNTLSSIENSYQVDQQSRRRSSIQSLAVPKFAVKPSYDFFNSMSTFYEKLFTSVGRSNDFLAAIDIEGAILTNELQNRAYHVLWTYISGRLQVISLGEMEAGPLIMGSGVTRRRGSSFTGINELGGYNFQDLDLLFATTFYIGKLVKETTEKVNVALHDLPTELPVSILNDYFCSHIPSLAKIDELEESERSNLVKFITIDKGLTSLPMHRQFGNESPNFDLDKVSNGFIIRM